MSLAGTYPSTIPTPPPFLTTQTKTIVRLLSEQWHTVILLREAGHHVCQHDSQQDSPQKRLSTNQFLCLTCRLHTQQPFLTAIQRKSCVRTQRWHTMIFLREAGHHAPPSQQDPPKKDSAQTNLLARPAARFLTCWLLAPESKKKGLGGKKPSQATQREKRWHNNQQFNHGGFFIISAKNLIIELLIFGESALLSCTHKLNPLPLGAKEKKMMAPLLSAHVRRG